MEKLFKSLDEQINILKNKGLIIDDEEQAKEILLRENYFFINGYRILLMNSYADKSFIIGSTFRELHSIFLFDRSIRNILFKNLMIIENQLKSVISYQLSKKYGYRDKEYLNIKNFTNDRSKSRKVRDIIDKMKRQIRINGEKHTATFHYMSKYKYVPLWILVKVLSFGLINELFGILKEEDKQEIADIYGLDKETLKIYIQLLSNYRNLCAHEDIVFDHKTQVYIDDTKYHSLLGLKQNGLGEYVQGKTDLFAVVIIFKQMLQKDRFKDFMKELEMVFRVFDHNVETITNEKLYDRMGFPNNYMDLIDM